MRIESQLQLLAKIEEALALADAEQAHDVALWLDRARIAAGGTGEMGSNWRDLDAERTSSAPPLGDGSCARQVA